LMIVPLILQHSILKEFIVVRARTNVDDEVVLRMILFEIA